MSLFLSELLTAIVAFASTNVDDLLLLSSLFMDSELRTASVVSGQFVGMSLLVLVSIVAAHFMVSIPTGWIGLLGFIPLSLGILRLMKLFRTRSLKPTANPKESEFVGKEQMRVPWMHSEVALATLLTLANGGDNLSVYVPLFAVQREFVPLYVAVFSAMTAVWCLLGYILTNHPIFHDQLRRYAGLTIPWILIGIGLKVLWQAAFCGGRP
jgi:cadmium resistance protein CadD (predicted permease)